MSTTSNKAKNNDCYDKYGKLMDYSDTLPLIKTMAGKFWGREYHGEDHIAEWDIYYTKGFHMKLEEADLKDEWDWVKEHIGDAEYFFLFHVRMTSCFEWTNWTNWYHTFMCDYQ